eukprot:m.28649 g.28649  ORF g.28649 m.28649 type:complete len:444 (-) comp8021_c0_seq1:54-1385(-)
MAAADLHDELSTLSLGNNDLSLLLELPKELLLRIVSYAVERGVDPQTWNNLSLTCKYLRAICKDASVRVILDPLATCKKHQMSIPNTDCALRWVRGCPHLEILRLTGDELDDYEMGEMLRGISHLKDLEISFNRSVLGTTIAENINVNQTNLRCLNVEGNAYNLQELFTMLQPLRLVNLEELNITQCQGLSDIELAPVLQYSKKMKVFRADGVHQFSTSGVVRLAQELGTTLTELELDGAEVLDPGLIAISENCPVLRKLWISFCQLFTDIGLKSLTKMKNLTSLKLRKGFEFSNEAIHHLFNAGQLDNLTYLDLTECTGIKNSALAAIGMNCPNLKIVNFSWCWDLTEAGIEHIIENCRELYLLNCTGLKRLTDGPLQNLQRRLPELHVLICKNANRVSDDLLYDLFQHGIICVNYYGDVVGGEQEEVEHGSITYKGLQLHY